MNPQHRSPTRSDRERLAHQLRWEPSMGSGYPGLPCFKGLVQLLLAAQPVNITALTGPSYHSRRQLSNNRLEQ